LTARRCKDMLLFLLILGIVGEQICNLAGTHDPLVDGQCRAELAVSASFNGIK
jgi:hypothetical protein